MLLLTLIRGRTIWTLLLSSEFRNSRAVKGKYFKRIICLATLFFANRTASVGFEVLTPVTMKITVCWVVTSLVF
jgi:hypothetical protein